MSQSYELDDEQSIGSCCTRCWLTQVESDMMCICMLPIFRWKCAVNMQEDGGEEKFESQVGLPLQQDHTELALSSHGSSLCNVHAL